MAPLHRKHGRSRPTTKEIDKRIEQVKEDLRHETKVLKTAIKNARLQQETRQKDKTLPLSL
ncbi:MAG TPA: hypothetical protein VMS95_06125, partial [Candidatus Krumholzibacteriaceae bacterium]|nr:hypothetical protein [Candidatus Krumholzibacteriaceae bacterium]